MKLARVISMQNGGGEGGWGRGIMRKAHSITDLWLLDAPVASEINTRVYMYTFLRAAARQCVAILRKLSFSIKRLCIL